MESKPFFITDLPKNKSRDQRYGKYRSNLLRIGSRDRSMSHYSEFLDSPMQLVTQHQFNSIKPKLFPKEVENPFGQEASPEDLPQLCPYFANINHQTKSAEGKLKKVIQKNLRMREVYRKSPDDSDGLKKVKLTAS